MLTFSSGSYHYMKLDPDQASFDISKSPNDPFTAIKNLFTSGIDADVNRNAAEGTYGAGVGEKADVQGVTDGAV